jgi:hypothetical protein
LSKTILILRIFCLISHLSQRDILLSTGII